MKLRVTLYRWFAALTLSAAVVPALFAQTIVDSFQTSQTAENAAAFSGFFDAPETISGNRGFTIDDGASASIGGGEFRCTVGAGDDSACTLSYNFQTTYDLTRAGRATAFVIDVTSIQGPTSAGFLVSTGSQFGAVGELTLQQGRNVLPFAELIDVGGAVDVSAVTGFAIGFIESSQVVIDRITLDGGDGSSSRSVDASSSSTFYDPHRDGEGVQLVILPDQQTAVLSWYTYQEGEQLWLIGSGTIQDGQATLELISASGPQFGSGFRSEDVVREVWGQVDIALTTCDEMTLVAAPVDGGADLTYRMQRVVAADCDGLKAVGRSVAVPFDYAGTFYDPGRDGEGFQMAVEGDRNIVIATWYTYLNGEPVWLIGAGEATGNIFELPMTITSGASFGADFRAEDVLREQWGTIRFEYADCNSFRAQVSSDRPGFESLELFQQKIIQRPCSG